MDWKTRRKFKKPIEESYEHIADLIEEELPLLDNYLVESAKSPTPSENFKFLNYTLPKHDDKNTLRIFFKFKVTRAGELHFKIFKQTLEDLLKRKRREEAAGMRFPKELVKHFKTTSHAELFDYLTQYFCIFKDYINDVYLFPNAYNREYFLWHW